MNSSTSLPEEIVHGALDQVATIVGLHDLHARRQARAQLVELLLDRPTIVSRAIVAVAHDDDTADGFAFTVQFGDATPHLGP